MSDMADVLAGHTAWATTNPEGVWLVTCVDCKETLGTYDEIVKRGEDRHAYDQMDEALAAHQAAALSAAGFGPVQEAQREAWDEGYTTGNAHNGRRDANPYRTEASS